MTAEDGFALTPPLAGRVAARAIVLAAVSCRSMIEKDTHEPDAEKLRLRVVDWLKRIGVADEMEPNEISLLSTPLGGLDRKTVVDGTWQSEGMAVLAWALRVADLPPVHVECKSNDVADALGFLDDKERTALNRPKLREPRQIETQANTYLTLHWRLRQFNSDPGRMDLVNCVSVCKWADLRLEDLEILDRDLAIDGVRIEDLKYTDFRHTLSITQERHRALNWLLGFETLYSSVTTDT